MSNSICNDSYYYFLNFKNFEFCVKGQNFNGKAVGSFCATPHLTPPC